MRQVVVKVDETADSKAACLESQKGALTVANSVPRMVDSKASSWAGQMVVLRVVN